MQVFQEAHQSGACCHNLAADQQQGHILAAEGVGVHILAAEGVVVHILVAEGVGVHILAVEGVGVHILAVEVVGVHTLLVRADHLVVVGRHTPGVDSPVEELCHTLAVAVLNWIKNYNFNPCIA